VFDASFSTNWPSNTPLQIKNFLIAETRRKRVIYPPSKLQCSNFRMVVFTGHPPAKDIYSWSRLTPLADVKVIIVGQDPYHGPNQAHGLSFSVLPPTRPPPSLVNIYKELARSIPGFVIPKSGYVPPHEARQTSADVLLSDLSPLAAQGVLWLNTALTVRSGEPSSHSKQGWDKFTRAVMETVLKRPDHKGVVFMAWGAHAQKAINGFDKARFSLLSLARLLTPVYCRRRTKFSNPATLLRSPPSPSQILSSGTTTSSLPTNGCGRSMVLKAK
jgi:uracil-DNA glycosylase